MRFIFGGAYSGKTAFALDESGLALQDVVSGADCSLCGEQGIKILNGLHLLVKRLLTCRKDPFLFLDRLIKENPDIIIISDEIGSGIVPLEAEERLWREAAGRLCCEAVRRAQRVDRLLCGVPQRLK